MSAQTALMGGTALLSAGSQVMAGYSRAEGYGNNARALDFQSMVQMRQSELQEWQGEFSAGQNDFNAEIAANQGYLKRASLGRFDVEGAGYALQGEEVMLQTAQEERQRRAAIASLLSFNAADLASRGVEGGIGTSADVLEKHNVAQGEYDVANIRRIGESKKRYLSFAADDARINKQIGEIDAKNSDIEAESIKLQSVGIRLNSKLGGSMTRIGAAATKQAAAQQWAQVSPSIGMGWLQGAMTLGQAAMKSGMSFGGGGGLGGGSGMTY